MQLGLARDSGDSCALKAAARRSRGVGPVIGWLQIQLGRVVRDDVKEHLATQGALVAELGVRGMFCVLKAQAPLLGHT